MATLVGRIIGIHTVFVRLSKNNGNVKHKKISKKFDRRSSYSDKTGCRPDEENTGKKNCIILKTNEDIMKKGKRQILMIYVCGGS